jgi:hypothetical protein
MRGEVTLPKAYCISLPRDTAPLTKHCFYTSAFSNSYFVLSAMDGKIEQCSCIKVCVKLGKFATETLEMLHEAFGEHFISRTAVFK